MIRGAAGAGCATCCCCTFSLAAFLLCVSSKQGGAACTPRHVLLLQLQLELVMVMILLMVLMCSPPVEDTSLPADFHLQFFIVYTSFVGCKLCVARRTIGGQDKFACGTTKQQGRRAFGERCACCVSLQRMRATRTTRQVVSIVLCCVQAR